MQYSVYIRTLYLPYIVWYHDHTNDQLIHRKDDCTGREVYHPDPIGNKRGCCKIYCKTDDDIASWEGADLFYQRIHPVDDFPPRHLRVIPHDSPFILCLRINSHMELYKNVETPPDLPDGYNRRRGQVVSILNPKRQPDWCN